MSKSERNSRGRSREEALFPVPSGKSTFPDDYGTILDALKERIRSERLRKFAESWPERKMVQEALAQITWYHNLTLLEKCSDQPAIGLLLCRNKKQLVVEYALRGFSKPMGVARWETQLTETLPEDLKGGLPSIEEIEAELAGEDL